MGHKFSDKQMAEHARALEARRVLEECGVPLGADFHTLGSAQVDALLVAAKRMRYRKPKNANGSRARYFHAFLERRARGTVVDVVEGLERQRGPWAVVDGEPGGEKPKPGQRLPVLARFATEAEAVEYVGTLPGVDSGRYGIDGPEDALERAGGAE